MNIYNPAQIKAWDAYTIAHEPITSINLMERAAQKCVAWITEKGLLQKRFTICCGKGNNGGDGLAIARLLMDQEVDVSVYILEFGKRGSEDFEHNLQRLHETSCPIHFIQSAETFPDLSSDTIIVDALFGSGLNKPLDGLSAALVQHMNASLSSIIAIDVPSGLFMDSSSKGNIVIEAQYTLTFQCYKTALLVAENAVYFGEVVVLDIGLHPGFITDTPSLQQLVDESYIRSVFKPRQPFAHKGIYGHALLIAGGYGKIGAAVLATSACLRTGAGLMTTYIPKCGYEILQTSCPEAMTLTDENEMMITALPSDLEKYSVIGIGPGIGRDERTESAVMKLITTFNKPLMIDADALNGLAGRPQYLQQLPPYSVLTPHPKEFERLFGACHNDFERITTAQQKAVELQVIIVLKGHHTLIALPDGRSFFNSTGNAGMAKGGSGDILTGMVTSLLAQGYTPQEAVVLGVYIHGLAGDFAAEALSQEAMISGDIITFLSQVFKRLNRK